MFETPQVAHTQYSVSSEASRAAGALDLLLDWLIREVYPDKPCFSFGISTEEGGTVLNEGLIAQKEGFGGSAFVHDFYELAIGRNAYAFVLGRPRRVPSACGAGAGTRPRSCGS